MTVPSPAVSVPSLVTGNELPTSAVSWAAIFAGTVAAVASAVVLTSLGGRPRPHHGVGMAERGAAATTFTIGAGSVSS